MREHVSVQRAVCICAAVLANSFRSAELPSSAEQFCQDVLCRSELHSCRQRSVAFDRRSCKEGLCHADCITLIIIAPVNFVVEYWEFQVIGFVKVSFVVSFAIKDD